MPRLSPEEKLKQLDEQKKAIEAEKKKILVQVNAKKRKVRNHRLILLGVCCEKYFGEGIEPDKLDAILQGLTQQADKSP